jgi:GT2 family glycosyltransferase
MGCLKFLMLMPVYQAQAFLETTLEKLRQLRPQPDRYVFAENNSTDGTLTIIRAAKLRGKEIVRTWYRADAVQRLGSPYELMALERQMLLQRARRLDPDYAVFLDSDLWCETPDLLIRLTRFGYDITGGIYVRMFERGMFIAALWPEGGRRDRPYAWHQIPNFTPCDPTVAAVGGGCMCIGRELLQDRRVNFHPLPTDRFGPHCAEDYGYCLQAAAEGYTVCLDSSVDLQHYIEHDHMMQKPWRLEADGSPAKFTYANTVCKRGMH